MSSEQIKHMVNRFLQWKLPENFNPDGGISFKKTFNENSQWGPMKHEPVGTNLFDAFQAEAMVRYMVDGLPAERRTASMSKRVKIVGNDGRWWIQEYGGLPQGPFTRRIAEDILSKIVQRGEPAAEPQPEKGWLKPILEQARADINARPARQKSRVAPAAPAPAAPLLSALDIAKKLVNVGDIDRREKILKQWVDSYIARWAAELEQVRKAFRNYLAGAISKRAAEAALGEKGKR